MEKGGQRHSPPALLQGKRLGIHSRRGYIGCQAGKDLFGGNKISYLHLGFNPGPSSPYRVSVPTALSLPSNGTGLVQIEAR